MSTVVIPLVSLGVAFVILVALVLLKQTVFAVGRSLRDLGASDLHLTAGMQPRVRIDGDMRLLPGSEAEALGVGGEDARDHGGDHAVEEPGAQTAAHKVGEGLIFSAHPAGQEGL